MSDFDPANDQPAPNGLFGLASPGRVIAIAVPVLLIGLMIAAHFLLPPCAANSLIVCLRAAF